MTQTPHVVLLKDVRACGPGGQLSADRCQLRVQPLVETVPNNGRRDPGCRQKHCPELGALGAFLPTFLQSVRVSRSSTKNGNLG